MDDTTEFIDQTQAERLVQELGLEADQTQDTGWINSRLLVEHSPAAQTPLRDVRLRRAINVAMDRNRFGQQMFQRWFYLVGPVPAPIERWALPLAELTKRPGYRFSTQEREEDLAEAKKLWEAAGGPALKSITVTYPGFPNWTAVHGPRAGARRVAQRGFESCRGHYRPNFGVYPLFPPTRA